MISDSLNLVIWCVGVVGMATAAWVQDRREVRRDNGEAETIRKEFSQKVSTLQEEVKALRIIVMDLRDMLDK